MRKLSFIILFCILTCCNQNNDNNTKNGFISNNLKQVLNDYQKNSGLNFSKLNMRSKENSKFAYPSYHLYFKKKENDTILSIILFPHYNNFELEEKVISDDETIHQIVQHKGWILYKEKYPLIIFDANNYSNKLIQTDRLNLTIPDSLKTQIDNQRINFVKWDYQINNGNLKRIKKEDNDG